jgi:hypothetical protein
MYPFSNLSAFAERCESIELFLFGRWLPLRSYTYLGSSSAFLFFPFWSLIHDPIVVRIFSGILWFANGYLISRCVRVNWIIIMTVVMLSTPVLAQSIIDSGPSSLQFLMIESCVLLCLRALAKRSFLIVMLYGILAGLCSFVAIEQKAFAVHGAAFALFILTTGYLRNSWNNNLSQRLARFCIFVAFSAATAAPLLYKLFFAMAKYGGRYIDVMLNASRSLNIGQLEQWKKHFWWLFDHFALMPGAYFHRNYNFVTLPDYPPNLELNHLKIWVAASVLCFVVLAIKRDWRNLFLIPLSWILAFVDLVMISKSDAAWAGHHTIFAHIVIIVGVATAIGAIAKRRLLLVAIPVVSIIAFLNLQTTWGVIQGRPANTCDQSRDIILKVVDQEPFASEHLVLHLSWGAYFLDSLFGPKSQALARSDVITSEIRKLAANNGRKLAVVKLAQPGWERSEDALGLRIHTAPTGGSWELWVQD